MIEVNLLPPSIRVKKKEQMSLPNLPIIPAAIGAVSLLIVIQILLILLVQINSMTLSSLKNKIGFLSKSNQEAVLFDATLKEVSAKIDTIGKLANARFNVARKLNDLSDSMIAGVWLRSLDVTKGESLDEPGILRQLLIIEGSNIVTDENKEGSIGKFVNSLKDNTSFAADFDNIELAKVERKKIRNTEIMDFVIICHFKKGKGL